MTNPEDLNGPLCQCGETMDMYHGTKVCPHCDQQCENSSCPICRRYGYHVRARVTDEHGKEHRDR